MKNLKLTKIGLVTCMLCTVFAGVYSQTSCDTVWTKEKAQKWFNSNLWTSGLQLKPNESINVCEFAKQYQNHTSRWTKAFLYLKETNLDTLKPGKYFLDGDDVYVSVTETPTKNFELTKWEAHRKYADIQYVIRGEEKIGVAPFSKATEVEMYNDIKDIGFYNVPEKEETYYVARPGGFFIFFPSEAHRPGIKIEPCLADKKIVVKVKMD